MESTHGVKYSVNSVISHEQDLIELAKDMGIEIPQHILRILVQLLEEGIHPSALSKLCRDLCRSARAEPKPVSGNKINMNNSS